MNRLLILPAFLLTLLVVTPAFADDFEAPDETAKAEWAESSFAKSNFLRLVCEAPTESCFRRAERITLPFMLAFQMGIKGNFLPKRMYDCLMRVEGTKRHRAWMNWIKDNHHRTYTPEVYYAGRWDLIRGATPSAKMSSHIGDTWIKAMSIKFPHCL